MLKIGLTGGIGSGKSFVADLLAEYGASIIDTDNLAHQLTMPGGLAIPEIKKVFGDQVISPNGALDRTAMRERVFKNKQDKLRLEAILHPMIGRAVAQAAVEAQGLYLVYVVPLLVESGNWRERVHRICVVDCDEATQISRVQQRSGLDPDMIRSIMAVQAHRDERLAAADDVIINDVSTSVEELRLKVRSLHEFWMTKRTN